MVPNAESFAQSATKANPRVCIGEMEWSGATLIWKLFSPICSVHSSHGLSCNGLSGGGRRSLWGSPPGYGVASG